MHAVAVSLLEQETRGEHLLGMSRHVQLLSGTVRDSAAFKHIPSTRGTLRSGSGQAAYPDTGVLLRVGSQGMVLEPAAPMANAADTTCVPAGELVSGDLPDYLELKGCPGAAVGKVDRIQRAEAEALAGAQGQHSKQLPGPLPWCLGQVVATGQMLPRMTTSSLSGSVGQVRSPRCCPPLLPDLCGAIRGGSSALC